MKLKSTGWYFPDFYVFKKKKKQAICNFNCKSIDGSVKNLFPTSICSNNKEKGREWEAFCFPGIVDSKATELDQRWVD